jgi:hypothetical protein
MSFGARLLVQFLQSRLDLLGLVGKVIEPMGQRLAVFGLLVPSAPFQLLPGGIVQRRSVVVGVVHIQTFSGYIVLRHVVLRVGEATQEQQQRCDNKERPGCSYTPMRLRTFFDPSS